MAMSYFSLKALLSAVAFRISPAKIVWSPVFIVSFTLHSKCAMHSFIRGGLTFSAGLGVSPVILNLS